MAKFISDIHEFIDFLTGKGQTGYHTPEEKDNAIHVASRTLFDEKKKVFELTREITNDLLPFLTDPTTLSLNGSGIATKPTNLKYLVALTAGASEKKVDEVDKAMLPDRRNSPLCPPSADYPICTFYNSTIQFYPVNITNVKITYLKEPVKPVWAYTIDEESERVVYDDDASVDIEWGEENHNEIIIKTMDYLGINLREGDLLSFSQMKKQDVV